MSPSSDRLPTPGEILQGWQRGACEFLQNVHRTAQHLNLLALHESSKAFQHFQDHHGIQPKPGAVHLSFASVTASILPRPGVKRGLGWTASFSKRPNCVIDSLADAVTNASTSGPTKSHDTATEEKILFSEVQMDTALQSQSK